MQVEKILDLFGISEDDNTQSSPLPVALVEQMLITNEQIVKERAITDTMSEVFCRLLASGMTSAEIAVVLRARADTVREVEERYREQIRAYAKQLKARHRNAENSRAENERHRKA